METQTKHKKQLKTKVIAEKSFSGMYHKVTFNEILSLSKEILPTDIIQIERVEEFYSENNSWNEHTILQIIREVEETDEEFDKRIKEAELFKEESKKRRYESFLKLKKEFEPEPEIPFHKGMNIFAMEGHKVKCSTLTAGYDSEQEKAKRYLIVGNTYIIDHTIVNNWSTEVYLKEFPLICFNSVFFEDVDEQATERTKEHPDYQRYNKF